MDFFSFFLQSKSAKVLQIGNASWLQEMFSFKTNGPETNCTAITAVVPDSNGGWRIWVLRTVLEQLKDQGNVDVLETKNGIINGIANGIANGVNGASSQFEATHFDCVVIGVVKLD